jgi:hypothetical protein
MAIRAHAERVLDFGPTSQDFMPADFECNAIRVEVVSLSVMQIGRNCLPTSNVASVLLPAPLRPMWRY